MADKDLGEVPITRVKKSLVFNVSGVRAPGVEYFRVEVANYGDKCRVVLTGRITNGRGARNEHRSEMFNISGYEGKSPAPPWLRQLIRRAELMAEIGDE